MHRPTVLRPLLAALLAVAAWTGAARAQEHGGYNAPVDPKATATRPNPVCNYFRPCWTHFNSDYGCSSFSSEMHFLFGGCRQFFGEPCFNGPPANGPCTSSRCDRK